MKRTHSTVLTGALALTFISTTHAQTAPSTEPYKVLKTVKVGGAGGFDYVYADSVGRRLYVPRTGIQGSTPPVAPRVSVFDLDTLAPVGEIADANAVAGRAAR